MWFSAAQQWIFLSNSLHNTNGHQAQKALFFFFKIKVQDANSSMSAVLSVTQAANRSVIISRALLAA